MRTPSHIGSGGLAAGMRHSFEQPPLPSYLSSSPHHAPAFSSPKLTVGGGGVASPPWEETEASLDSSVQSHHLISFDDARSPNVTLGCRDKRAADRSVETPDPNEAMYFKLVFYITLNGQVSIIGIVL